MTDFCIRAARSDELCIVEDLLKSASAWLASRGIDQWQFPPHRDRIMRALDRGECFLVFLDDRPVGTLQVDSL